LSANYIIRKKGGVMNAFDKINAIFYDFEQVQKVKTVKVGIAGAGGLGSNCAAMLVRAGIVNLTVVDFDEVSLLNLNRQFFFADQVGQKKVEALGENLLRINPDLNLSLISQKITKENIDKFFKDVDIVVEALDTPEAKVEIAQRFLLEDKYFVCASGVAFYGNCDRFRVREIGKNSWVVGDEVSDVKDMPPYAPCVQICAAKQADKVLEITLDLIM
jgi:sulfur carrier protein ThiS adenylyltransferase